LTAVLSLIRDKIDFYINILSLKVVLGLRLPYKTTILKQNPTFPKAIWIHQEL